MFLGFMSATTTAQQVYTLNLAENEGDTLIETNISPGYIHIELFNQIPEAGYLVNFKEHRVINEPFDLEIVPEISIDSSMFFLPPPAPVCTNDSLITANLAMSKVDEESKVPSLLAKMNTALKDTMSNCTTEVATALRLKTATRNQTKKVTIKNNYDTFMIVERITEDGDRKRWIVKFESERKGEWRTMYGFNFSWNQAFERESYFSQQTDTVFTVTKADNNEILSYLPTVFFVWQPYKGNTKIPGLVPGFMAGIGIEDNNPAITTGLILTIRDNVGITIGATIHQQQFLRGQYSEGQIIKESLTEDQLHEKTYRINPSFSVAFRFNTSPFKSE